MTFDSSSLQRSYDLSRLHVSDAVSPHELAKILTEAKAEYVLIGGHILGYFTGTPRATVDVDAIVSSADINKAVRAVQAKYPELTVQDLIYNVRFNSVRSEGRVGAERVDLVRNNAPLFARILQRYAVTVSAGGQSVRVPTVEAAVAMKFAAVISPNRGNESRPQDRADLMSLVSLNRSLKLVVLKELGDLVYPGGGGELTSFCSAVWQGKTVSL
jgi:hypothetical protein